MIPPEPSSDEPLQVSDFRLLFESSPDLFLVVDASEKYRIVAASDAYLRATRKDRADIVGSPLFTAFPDNPADPSAADHAALQIALAHVRQTGESRTVDPYQYNLALPGGGSEQHYWQTGIWPVFPAGKPLPGQRPQFLLCRTEDVTRRTVAEAAMEDASARLEATLGAAEIGTWVWDMTSNRFTVDRNLARMFSLDPVTAASGPLEHFTGRIVEEDRARVGGGIEAAVRDGGRFEMEYRIRNPDGTVRWVAARGWAEQDAVGKAVRFPGVVIDITERRRTGAALHESDERLRMAIELTGLGTFDYDPRADVLQWSDACRKIFGAAPDEPVSYEKTLRRALHPDDRERTMAALAEALRPGGAGYYEIEYRAISPLDGLERWVAARGRALFDENGRARRFIGTVLDITAHKRAEEATLRRTGQLQKLAGISARLNAAHDVASVLGIVTEEARLLIGARQAVASVVGMQEGRDGVTVASHADKDADSAKSTALPDTLPAGIDLPGPVRVTRAERESLPDLADAGGGAPGGWLATPLVGRTTRRLGVIQLLDKTADDFTEDDEAVLAQLAQIAAVAIENARLYEELRSKDRRKDEFLAMLAHELRNPLAAIRNAVALGSEAEDPADSQWSTEVINRQMKKLSRLIDDLLDVSRITQGKVQLRKELLDAAALLHSAADTVRPLMQEREHEMTIALRPGTLNIEADPTRLEQVMFNLLANAAKYTEKGGEISLRARREDDQIVIRVRDNGIGIPPEKLSQMFELFAQGDRTLARSEGGLGIGLTLARSLVEMHGGTVEAVSAGKGHGTEMIVRLPAAAEAVASSSSDNSQAAEAAPLAPAPRQDAAPEPAREPAPGLVPAAKAAPAVRRRVLVVDDNVDSARGTGMILTRTGHDVRLAYDGPSAVEVALEFRPEFVLLDIGLPGLDGYEVAQRLRQDEHTAGATLIAVSGYGQESDRRRSKEAGFDRHLVKPVDPGVVIELLR